MTRAKGGNIEIISISLEPKIVEAVDKTVEVLKFGSRSALVEFALKKFVVEVITDGKIQSRAFE